MKIVVIDGQGGRMGSAFIDKWIKSGGDPKELIAVGTNAMATSAMMKAGAVKAATGENPVVVNTSGADFVVGPIGIIAADALLGEITPKMAQAVASCTAQKVLLPVNTCMFHVVGVSDNRLSDNIDEAISYILKINSKILYFCHFASSIFNRYLIYWNCSASKKKVKLM